jgi:hypothetical protein
MIDISLTGMIGQKVSLIYLIVCPPFGEENMSDIDISIGFVFDSNNEEMIVISTSKDDNWSPTIFKKILPLDVYPFEVFEGRMNNWMNKQLKNIIDLEYYNVTTSKFFINIINEKIKSIELIKIEQNEPFGVKIVFEKDFIMSTSIADGNTIETKKFNNYDNIRHFKKLGEINFIPISDDLDIFIANT